MRSETLRLQHEQSQMKEKIRDNGEKIKQNKVLPYLVANVVEVELALSSNVICLNRTRQENLPSTTYLASTSSKEAFS